MSILDRVGRYSKIDENVCDSYDLATAAKIASVARYMFMTEDPINRIEDFDLSHELPYPGMSADICDKLFHDVGGDSNSEKNLFLNFAFIARNTPIIAFESNVTTGSYEDEFPSQDTKRRNIIQIQ